MLDIKNKKVIDSYMENNTLIVKFDNGVVLKTHDYSLIYNLDKNIFNKLSNRNITENILSVETDKIIDMSIINSDFFLDIEIKDLIGMRVDIEVLEDYIYVYLVFSPEYLIENSSKFNDCKTEEEITEYNENVFNLYEVSLESENPEFIYNFLNTILN